MGLAGTDVRITDWAGEDEAWLGGLSIAGVEAVLLTGGLLGKGFIQDKSVFF